MGLVSQSSALQVYSQQILNAIDERKKPSLALKSWFPTQESDAYEFSVEKRGMGRPIAYDVNYSDKATMYKRGKGTQHVYRAPVFKLGTPMNATDAFFRVFGTRTHVDTVDLRKFTDEVSVNMLDNLDRIERAEELQRAQCLESGIVTLTNGDNIDFRRESASLIAYNAAHDFGIGTVNPGVIMAQQARFCVQEGTANGDMAFDYIMGREAWDTFRGNSIRQAEGDIKDQKFMSLTAAEVMPSGLVFLGSYSYSSFKFNIWGYEGVYDGGTNNIPYINPKKGYCMTPGVKQLMWYGATPRWSQPDNKGVPLPFKGVRNYEEFRDAESHTIKYVVSTAPIATLLNINDIATAQVVAP